MRQGIPYKEALEKALQECKKYLDTMEYYIQ